MIKKVIITGCFGHIGSKLVEKLSKTKLNYKIILIDNFETERYSSIFVLKKNKNIKFYNINLYNSSIPLHIGKIDAVIHFAAKTNAEQSIDKKMNYIDNNYKITKKIVNFCIKNKSKLLYISSTSVYGSNSKIVDESCPINLLNPQSPYAISKIKEESYISNKSKKLEYVIYRFGTIFGYSQGMRFHTAVNKFCFQAAINQPITVWKTALNQKRPYLCLDDAVRLIEFTLKNKIFDNQIYNAVTLNTSVKSIINIIKKSVKRIKINYINSKIMNQLSYNVSNTKIKNKGFIFKGNINKSINKTLNNISKFNYK